MKTSTALAVTQAPPFQAWRTATHKALADMRDTAAADDTLKLMGAEIAALRKAQDNPAPPRSK